MYFAPQILKPDYAPVSMWLENDNLVFNLTQINWGCWRWTVAKLIMKLRIHLREKVFCNCQLLERELFSKITKRLESSNVLLPVSEKNNNANYSVLAKGYPWLLDANNKATHFDKK